ncbi:site-specific integrase [Neptuniibacter sp.]|uniref:site-specific integrase n=1 Tax=Neptuniibacter sp. TaxID=1962643 RepID=UPI00261A1D8B|nr:site-specific integrase [Neptuniibacter sp.]MCP4596857.1 tyrosine-type recombinase/integrase [Neptuniibacter sp.]
MVYSRSSAYLEQSRHGVFYFRIRIPIELTPSFSQSQIRRSLKTKCRREAVQRCSVVLEQVCSIFDLVREGKCADLSELTWKKPKLVRSAPEAPTKSPVSPKIGPKLSVVLNEYLHEQRREGVGIGTVNGKKAVANLFIRVVGDKPIDQITREDARKFKTIALQLPPRIGQMPEQPLDKVISEATETISTTTFNNYVKNLTTIFTYAIREGYCSRNPAEGLKVKQRVKASEFRSRFSENDLTHLFQCLRFEPYQDTKPYRKWLPLLGLFTGARLNELCQLYLDEVINIDGIDCLHIQAEHPDQRLKNQTSERLIPLHPRLKELGFLEFVQSQRTLGRVRLFSELRFHKQHRYTHAPSRWFANVRAKAGFNNSGEKKDFHSFRHTVADHLKQLGVTEGLIAGLLGHKAGGITYSRYGKEYSPEKILPVVELLDFRV